MEFWQRLANLMSAFDIKSKELAHKRRVNHTSVGTLEKTPLTGSFCCQRVLSAANGTLPP